MSALMTEVAHRWETLFRQLEAGDDAPPSQRLRLEGLMEALVISGELGAEELQAAMDACYQRVSGESFSAALGDGWTTAYPFPQIPAFMRRAPVYPSTRD